MYNCCGVSCALCQTMFSDLDKAKAPPPVPCVIRQKDIIPANMFQWESDGNKTAGPFLGPGSTRSCSIQYLAQLTIFHQSRADSWLKWELSERLKHNDEYPFPLSKKKDVKLIQFHHLPVPEMVPKSDQYRVRYMKTVTRAESAKEIAFRTMKQDARADLELHNNDVQKATKALTDYLAPLSKMEKEMLPEAMAAALKELKEDEAASAAAKK